MRNRYKCRPARSYGCQWIGARCGWLKAGLDPISALVSITADELKNHAHIIGETGCGKTNAIHHLVAQDLERRHSLVIFDNRGDLVNAATELAASKVDPSLVKVIDLRERVRPFGFNPLSGAGEPYFRALAVLDAVSHQSESWGPQLAETLRNALMLISRCRAPLTSLERLFSDPSYRAELLAGAVSDPGLHAFWTEFSEFSPQKQRKLTRPVMNKVSLLLATDTLRRILSHPTPINLGEHLNTPGSILLISLAVDELHGAGRMMGNMILASIHREIFARVAIPEAQRNPVRLYVDEFENFEMELFESLMVEGRRFKCPLLLAHQTLAQLPPRMRSVIFGNVGVRLTFRVGREDSHSISRDLLMISGHTTSQNFAPATRCCGDVTREKSSWR